MQYVYEALIAWGVVVVNLLAAFALGRRLIVRALRELMGGSLSAALGARPSRPSSSSPAASELETAAGET